MKEVFRYKDKMYLSMGALIGTNKLNRLEVSQLEKSGGIEEFEMKVDETYDPLLHKLDIQKGTFRKKVYTLDNEESVTRVCLIDGLPVTGIDIPLNTPTILTPSFLVSHIDRSWTTEKGRIVPTNIPVFKEIMIGFVENLVRDLRNVNVKFKTVEERLLFVAYGEAALRISNSVGYDSDMSSFEVEAHLYGIDPAELIQRTTDKYANYILVNRTLTVGMKLGKRGINQVNTYSNILALMKQARRDIQDRFNSQII